MAQLTHPYKLEWVKQIAPNVKHFAFAREDGAYLDFTPGQFITLHIPGPEKVLHRSYSIANPPGSPIIEMACAYVEGGRASEVLFNLQPGAHVEIAGPYGLLVLKPETPKRYFFIATGTGVTPYRSMLPALQERLEADPLLEIILIEGTRTRKELLFLDDFVQFAKHPRVSFLACLSRETEVKESYERLGHVQKHLNEFDLKPAQDIIYLCGNPFMIDEVFQLLTEIGFDRKAIRREKYVFSK